MHQIEGGWAHNLDHSELQPERERVIKKIKKDGGYYGFEALLTPYGEVEVWISS